MNDYSIKNTTKAQREQIVRECLGYSDISCDEGGGAYGYDFYQAYIDGEKELQELTQELRTSYLSGEEGPTRGNCGYI